MSTILINGGTLTYEDVVGVARYHKHVGIATGVGGEGGRRCPGGEAFFLLFFTIHAGGGRSNCRFVGGACSIKKNSR